jgi:hypothetical protein
MTRPGHTLTVPAVMRRWRQASPSGTLTARAAPACCAAPAAVAMHAESAPGTSPELNTPSLDGGIKAWKAAGRP